MAVRVDPPSNPHTSHTLRSNTKVTYIRVHYIHYTRTYEHETHTYMCVCTRWSLPLFVVTVLISSSSVRF